MTTKRSQYTRSALAAVIMLSLTLGACAPGNAQRNTPTKPETTAPPSTPREDPPATGATEAATLKPRLAITHDNGITVLDATTLEQVTNIPAAGFLRLSALGDNRNLAVSGPGGFALLDLGTWAETHGDHAHYYTHVPTLSEVSLAAEKPGHVIPHDGLVAFFDDATGTSSVFNIATFDPEKPKFVHRAPSAHHGLTIPREDGTIITTSGTTDHRSAVLVIDSEGKTLAQTENCPGVHGEAVAKGGVATVGCEDGILVIDGQTITKIESPAPYGRIGNQRGSAASEIVLGDYKTDKDGELERTTRITLTNTRTNELKVVDLPASYSFRSLARDTDGTPLILGTDGAVHVISEESAKVTASIPVMPAWQEPVDWQAPRPTIFSLAGSVFVTDPENKMLYALDIETRRVWNKTALDVVPNEVNGVEGHCPLSIDDSGHTSHDDSDDRRDSDEHGGDDNDGQHGGTDHDKHDH